MADEGFSAFLALTRHNAFTPVKALCENQIQMYPPEEEIQPYMNTGTLRGLDGILCVWIYNEPRSSRVGNKERWNILHAWLSS